MHGTPPKKKVSFFFLFVNGKFRSPEFEPGPVHVGFMMDKWHWYKFFPEYLGFHISIIMQMLHSHILFVYHGRCIFLTVDMAVK